MIAIKFCITGIKTVGNCIVEAIKSSRNYTAIRDSAPIMNFQIKFVGFVTYSVVIIIRPSKHRLSSSFPVDLGISWSLIRQNFFMKIFITFNYKKHLIECFLASSYYQIVCFHYFYFVRTRLSRKHSDPENKFDFQSPDPNAHTRHRMFCYIYESINT